MSTFFQQTAQAMIAKHIDRFPLMIEKGRLKTGLTRFQTTFTA